MIFQRLKKHFVRTGLGLALVLAFLGHAGPQVFNLRNLARDNALYSQAWVDRISYLRARQQVYVELVQQVLA